jgi:hypothetical protein
VIIKTWLGNFQIEKLKIMSQSAYIVNIPDKNHGLKSLTKILGAYLILFYTTYRRDQAARGTAEG